MQNLKEKSKLTLNTNNIKLIFQLVILGVVFFFVFDQGLLNELRYIFEVLNLRGVDKILVQVLLPFKTFFDLSQLVSFTYFVFKIILAVVIVPLIIYFVVKTISKVFVNKKQHSYNFESISTANFKAVYIVQQKFLC